MAKQAFDDDLLLTPAMRERFDLEATFDQDVSALARQPGSTLLLPYNIGSWWAAVQRGNGEIERFTYDLAADPTEAQQVVLMEMLRRINREIAHDGRWVAGWTHGNTRWIMMWVDPDGDVKFTVENEERWELTVNAGPLHWVEQCEDAWQTWAHYEHKVLAPSQEAQYKRAQGQRPPSVH